MNRVYAGYTPCRVAYFQTMPRRVSRSRTVNPCQCHVSILISWYIYPSDSATNNGEKTTLDMVLQQYESVTNNVMTCDRVFKQSSRLSL